MTAALINLNDLRLFTDGDPHAAWQVLRREAPVYWNPTEDGGFWALTRYRDVHDAYADPATFSSRQGTVLGGSFRNESDTASGRMLIASDDPRHRLLRRQVHRAFVPEVLDRVGPVVSAYLGEALDRFVGSGGGDFAEDVAPELPAGLLAVMFGLDRSDALHLLGLTRRMIGFQDPAYHAATRREVLAATQVEILDLMAELVRLRQRSPGEDLVSILLTAEVNGRRMSRAEILYNCLNVAVGGNETTPFTATAAVHAFIDHPDQFERLHADPSILPSALEEIFRWTSTNAYVQRTATRAVELGGVRIAAGDAVTLWNASANRDEAQFPAANSFDLTRSPNRHLAFGVGGHRCIGMAAAKLEISLLLQEILTRGLRFAMAGEATRLRSNFMLGHTSLPVTVRVGSG
ncbi:cytochrome P450 [Actinophytocola xanthii]|uniref:Cytochrome n=1 Tax=Actinophytocola xanthii TaxID=1912961 RepID=A0A1Q8CK38_9PSEU|nr:cytochrome P450 [Actinophytocola xanthii]OLF14711.1 cytochrome [Actinophytocola xanthii]